MIKEQNNLANRNAVEKSHFGFCGQVQCCSEQSCCHTATECFQLGPNGAFEPAVQIFQNLNFILSKLFPFTHKAFQS